MTLRVCGFFFVADKLFSEYTRNNLLFKSRVMSFIFVILPTFSSFIGIIQFVYCFLRINYFFSASFRGGGGIQGRAIFRIHPISESEIVGP